MLIKLLIFASYSFNDLAWAEYDESKRGIVAGALDSGSLDLWDADKLLNGTRSVVFSAIMRNFTENLEVTL